MAKLRSRLLDTPTPILLVKTGSSGSLTDQELGFGTGPVLPARLFSVPKPLLLTRIADHFDSGNLHVSVLGITLLHTCILGHFLGVFLHIVKLRMGDNAGCSNRVTHMFGKDHSAAPHFRSEERRVGKEWR